MSPIPCQCPACGFCGELEAFFDPVDWKRVLVLRDELPALVQPNLWEYLALFRPDKRALTGKRTLKILTELRDLTTTGRVRWERSEERPCPPDVWAEAMRAAIEREPRLEHLTDHNYIRHTAWGKARPLAARTERDNEARKVSDRGRPVLPLPEGETGNRLPGRSEGESEPPATAEDIRALAEALGKAFDGGPKKNCHTCKDFEPPRWCRLDPKAVKPVNPAEACGKHRKR